MTKKKRNQDLSACGLSQLTMVEHALCPLDTNASLLAGFCHQTSYRYSDGSGARQTAEVRVTCPDGLSPTDEFYLWGLLALTFAQPVASTEFYATPHYCLRQLGVITPDSKGGKTYELFRQALRRLSSVSYENDSFFDPIRKEHRRAHFGLLSYSLPVNEQSGRVWRIIWDTQFFEFCQATGGALRFDLDVYRQLDPATRRLFLLLQKVFYRKSRSPRLGIRQLAVTAMGFRADQRISKLRSKIDRCSALLVELGCLAGVPRFTKRGDGGYLEFERGPRFERPHREVSPHQSPLVEPLSQIGMDGISIRWVLRTFEQDLVRVWSDVTLAAIEQKPKQFFKRSAAAFLIDNLKAASQRKRTPPDWFLALEKRELRRLAEAARPRDPKSPSCPERVLSPDLDGRKLSEEMTAQFVAAGQTPYLAKQNAERFVAAKRNASRVPANNRRRKRP